MPQITLSLAGTIAVFGLILRDLWITDLNSNGKAPTVIYVPTEGNLP